MLTPLMLYEAVISLWPAGPDGTAVLDDPVFLGAAANLLNLTEEFDEETRAASGDAYQTAYHLNERHEIEIGRTFVLSMEGLGVPRMVRNRKHVLEIVWTSLGPGRHGRWYRRVYYGVTWRSNSLRTSDALDGLQPQHFRAQRYVPSDDALVPGQVTPPPIFTPPPAAAGEVAPVGFFRETPLIVGEYLIGIYQWADDMVVLSATAIAGMPNGTPCVIALEINGVVSPAQLTLPFDSGYVGDFPTTNPVEASATYSGITIPAGSTVRWKVLSGPDPENAAGNCAVSMMVQGV